MLETKMLFFVDIIFTCIWLQHIRDVAADSTLGCVVQLQVRVRHAPDGLLQRSSQGSWRQSVLQFIASGVSKCGWLENTTWMSY